MVHPTKSKTRVVVESKTVIGYMTRKCRSLRAKAKKQGIPFDLTPSFLLQQYESQEGVCGYTGVPLRLDYSEMEPDCLSVDRVDPRKGYVQTNVLLCSALANTMKGTKDKDEFLRTLRTSLRTALTHVDRLVDETPTTDV